MYAAAGGNEEVLLQLLGAGATRALVDAAVSGQALFHTPLIVIQILCTRN